jgi:hypothetical protein
VRALFRACIGNCATETLSRIHALVDPDRAWHRLGESVQRLVTRNGYDVDARISRNISLIPGNAG